MQVWGRVCNLNANGKKKHGNCTEGGFKLELRSTEWEGYKKQ